MITRNILCVVDGYSVFGYDAFSCIIFISGRQNIDFEHFPQFSLPVGIVLLW